MAHLTIQQAFALAVRHQQAGALRQAEQIYRQILMREPAHAPALHQRGLIAGRMGRHDVAADLIRQALALKPDFPEAHNNLGVALKEQGKLDAAIAAYRAALALKPDYTEALYNLGVTLGTIGQFEEAADCIRRAWALHPEARFSQTLAAMHRRTGDPAEMERLGALVNQTELPVDDRIAAEFTLGKMLDEAEQLDDAFEHFANGNRLFLESRPAAVERFDAAELQRMVDRDIRDFTPEFFAQRRAWGDPSELPVFIVGMPRSGTSLVEQIAASHPAVFGAGELAIIGNPHAGLPGGGKDAGAPEAGGASAMDWNAASIAGAAQAYLKHVRSLGGEALRVTDKWPHNVFQLGLIAVMFPDARVIFCRRDPRDNCLSCYFQHFIKNNLLYTYDLADCGRQFLETDRIIAHWLKALPLRMLEMQYETLVEQPEPQSRRLIDFLGLPWDPACLEFHRTRRPVLTASVWQVRQPMYNTSIGRWRHYEKHLGALLNVLENGR